MAGISLYAIFPYAEGSLFDRGGRKAESQLNATTRGRIDRKLALSADTGQGDMKRLKGREGARLRIGDWRVIFTETADSILVVAVGHRHEIYD